MRRSPNLMDDHVLKRDGRAGFLRFLCPLSLLLPLCSPSTGSVDRSAGSFRFHRRNVGEARAARPSVFSRRKAEKWESMSLDAEILYGNSSIYPKVK